MVSSIIVLWIDSRHNNASNIAKLDTKRQVCHLDILIISTNNNFAENYAMGGGGYCEFL
jgi:hypothetical protein